VGYFSDRKALVLDKRHLEIEGRVGFFGGNEFTLVVDKDRIDKQKGSLYGFVTLRGRLPDGRAIVVNSRPNRLTGGLTRSVPEGMRYELEVDDRTFEFGNPDAPPTYTTDHAEPEALDIEPAESVRRALRELESLRTDGMVSDDEYTAKRREILGRL
jgi:hypothetical protein